MNFNRTTIWITAVSVLLLVVLFFAWFFFFRSTATVSTDGNTSGLFGGNPNTTTNTTPASTDKSGTEVINTTTTATQKIFKITDGPIVGATLLQTLRPTTTVARYIRQDDGHVFDLPVGVAGAVPRVVSNITIPGGQRAIWLEGGSAAVMQYVDESSVVKTVYLGFPTSTTTSAVLPTRIEFLPDNIIDIAASPDGKSVAYLIGTSLGADGYVTKSDGSNSKKTFSLPLSQLLLSWPSQNTILAQTKPSAGVTGMAFSVDVKSSAASQLVTAPGLSASANKNFSIIIYQTTPGSTKPLSYSYNVKNGLNNRLSFNPIPEKCIWSNATSTALYCASPLQDTPANYVDLWHQGIASAPDTIFTFDLNAGTGKIYVIPGSTDGGVASDIVEMALSPDEHYLSYTTKTSRSLWGVLLSK